jgi:hypothetical protein
MGRAHAYPRYFDESIFIHVAMTSLTPSARHNFAACIVMLVVTTISVLLRIAVRLSLRQAPLLADWLSILAFVLFCAYCGVMINCMSRTDYPKVLADDCRHIQHIHVSRFRAQPALWLGRVPELVEGISPRQHQTKDIKLTVDRPHTPSKSSWDA